MLAHLSRDPTHHPETHGSVMDSCDNKTDSKYVGVCCRIFVLGKLLLFACSCCAQNFHCDKRKQCIDTVCCLLAMRFSERQKKIGQFQLLILQNLICP